MPLLTDKELARLRTDKSFSAKEKKSLFSHIDAQSAQLAAQAQGIALLNDAVARLTDDVAEYAADAVTDRARIATLEAETAALAAKLAALSTPSVPIPGPTPPALPPVPLPTTGHGPSRVQPGGPIELKPGEVRQFKHYAWPADGSAEREYPATWSATGGTIDQTGSYAAGIVADAYKVTAQSKEPGSDWRTAEAIVLVSTLTGGVVSSPPSPPPEGSEDPDTWSEIIYDTRPGGAQDIESADTLAEAEDILQTVHASSGISSTGIGLAVNADGAGGRAFRLQLQAMPTGGSVTGSPTATDHATTYTGYELDQWAGAQLLYTSGALSGEKRDISSNDADGNFVTQAFGSAPSDGDTCIIVGDSGGELSLYLPGTARRKIMVQWEERLGKIASDSTGVGNNDAFDIYNENDSASNAGCKKLLLCRPREDDPGGCGPRTDHTWPGPAEIQANSHARVEGFYGETNPPEDTGSNLSDFHPIDYQSGGPHAGEWFRFTQEFWAESADGAGDGLVRYWYAGVLCAEHTGLANVGHEGTERLSFPTTFRSPRLTQSSYFRNIVVGVP